MSMAALSDKRKNNDMAKRTHAQPKDDITLATMRPIQRQVKTRGLEFCVEQRGDPKGVPIVFIMGLSCQMTNWPSSLLDGLAGQGYRVIRFDNRDIGLSEKVRSEHKLNLRSAFLKYRLGLRPKSSYTLDTMALDTVHILEALNIESAHIVGASMGGMIGQILASLHPEYVNTLTTMMSSTNSPLLPPPSLALMLKLGFAKKGTDKQDVIERWSSFWQAVQSPKYPVSKRDIEAFISANYERSYSAGGTLRQVQAILATGDIASYSKRIAAPTLVIHGDCDPLLRPVCAKAIKKHVPDAKLKLIKGMGHDLPEPLVPHFVELISEHISAPR